MNKETKNKLIWNAIPTLFDVKNPPQKVTPSRPKRTRSLTPTPSTSVKYVKKRNKSSDSVQHVSECDTPRKKHLKRKVQALKTKLWRKRHPQKVPDKE